MSLAEAKVVRISVEKIHPTNHTESTQRLDLTPWDLLPLAFEPMQWGILFNSKPLHSTWLNDLKTSLSKTLDDFYILAGHLATESNQDNTISFFVQCNNQGAEFIFATANIATSDILSPFHVPLIVRELFSLNDSINYDSTESQPLLSIQVNELIDGIFLGFTMNHIIADGLSFWHFINSWSEICKTGSYQFQKPPIFQRWFLNPTDLPIRFPVSTFEKSVTSYSSSSSPLPEIFLHFSPESVKKLKEKANLEINDNTFKISSLQAVLAYLWIGVTRARNLNADQTSQYLIAMGNRERLDPPLNNEYFGNYIGANGATAKVGELLNRGIGFAASLLNKAVSSHTNSKICADWKSFLEEPWLPSYNMIMPKNILITGGSPRFNIYGNDFGWGSPIAVRSGSVNKHDGTTFVYQGAAVGSIDINAWFSPNTMKRLGEDSDFLEVVGLIKR